MDILLVVLAGVLMILGLIGSLLPMLPGIPLSWVGLLLLHLSSFLPMNYTFLSITFFIALIIFALQYAIPALGTKYLGGSKSGMVGASIGLVIGIFTPIPFAILIGPFVGAYIGEIINKSDSRTALKAASGSFIGLLASSFMELVVTFIYLILFVLKIWEFRSDIFTI